MLSRRQARQKGGKAKIDIAIRFIRKGAISRARKAMESKGLGDPQHPEIMKQMAN